MNAMLVLGVSMNSGRKQRKPVMQQIIHPIQRSTRACHQCGKADAPKMCSRCNAVYYCNAEYQRQKWSSH